jgi:outer membrane receptor protein involved in Fe transport
MAGSYDSFDTSASVSGTSGKVSYALSGRYADSDGYRDNSDTEFKDIGGNLTWFLNDRLNLNFSTDYHKDSADLPGAILKSDFDAGVSRTDSLNPDDFADVEDYYFKAGPEIYFLKNSLFKADISYRKRSSVFDITFTGGSFVGDTDIKTVVFAPQVVFKEKIFNLENSLTIGFDYEKAKEDITNTLVFFGFEFPPDVFDLEKKTPDIISMTNSNLLILSHFPPGTDTTVPNSASTRVPRTRSLWMKNFTTPA